MSPPASLEKRNLWAETAPPPPEAPPLTGEATAEIAIIGAGFTGLAAALHAAGRGASVAVLEAETIGHGGSGRNVGLVNAGLWVNPDAMVTALGPGPAERLYAALAEGPAEVFALIARHGIDCEATRKGTLHLAHSPAGLKGLEERARQLQARGAPVTLLDRAETAARLGSARAHGALFDPRAGTIQPLAYAHGLAWAAARAGARLHGRSPVRALEPQGFGWRLMTPGGTLQARRVLIATNAYSGALEPRLKAAMVPMQYFQIATEPLGGNRLGPILAGGEGAWDSALVMTSIRRDQSGRLILGSVGGLQAGGLRLHRGWAERWLRRWFPALGPVSLTHGWDGRFAMTRDAVPRAAELAPGILAVWGYNGRGIGPGTVFGRAMADWALGGGADALPLPLSAPEPERWAALRALFVEAGARATHLL